jgi:hypothetical protein
MCEKNVNERDGRHNSFHHVFSYGISDILDPFVSNLVVTEFEFCRRLWEKDEQETARMTRGGDFIAT